MPVSLSQGFEVGRRNLGVTPFNDPVFDPRLVVHDRFAECIEDV